jgi:hypothetical protein
MVRVSVCGTENGVQLPLPYKIKFKLKAIVYG